MADVFDPRVFARGLPHESFQALRDHAPVSWQEEPGVLGWPAGPGFWAVTRYADVSHVLRDSEVFSSSLGATQIRDPDPGDLPHLRRMILNMDAPEHLRLRRLVTAVFTRRSLERTADRITDQARALLDAVAPKGRCDLPVDVTDDFPLANLADLIGVPAEDRRLLHEWTNRVIAYQDPELAAPVAGDAPPVNPRSPEQLADMFAYAHRLADQKRAQPGPDLMTALVQAEVDGRSLSESELEMFFFLMVIAGNDTVRSALPGGVLALAEHPEAYRALRRDPALLSGAIDEMLRWHPPVLSFRRTAACDTELGGVRLRRGDKVVVYHASAHFDERAFPEPYSFDIARSPNAHLAFGQGPHACLGEQFARMQLRIFFTQWLTAFPEVELDGPVVHLTSNFINGVVHLPLRWAP